MANVRGSVITARLKWVHDRFGEPGARQLKYALSPENRAHLEARVQPHEWAPLSLYLEVTTEIDRLWGKGDLGLARELGRASADFSMPTILKMFLRFGSPSYTVGKGAKLWSHHYDSGTLETREMRDDEGDGCEITLRDFAQPHRAHCLTVLGWAERTVELSGGRVIWARELACRVNGDPYCRFAARWR